MANETKTESSKGPRLTWRQKKDLGRRIWSDSPGLEVVHRDAAGIDIGSREHYAAVGPDRDAQPRAELWLFHRGPAPAGGVAQGMWRQDGGDAVHRAST